MAEEGDALSRELSEELRACCDAAERRPFTDYDPNVVGAQLDGAPSTAPLVLARSHSFI
jgi:hypothetical protein